MGIFKNIIKTKKFMAICGVAASITAAVVGVAIYKNRENTYRIIKVFEVEGSAKVARNKSDELNPYANMVLISGDRVSLEKGNLTLSADEDKYIYMEEQTELVLNATGNSENSRTKIDLIRGAITNELQHKLTAESSYEINTPNSTMSVRGTIFYVKVYEVDGVKYTKVTVFDGKVATKLVYRDGTVSEKEVTVEKGNEVTIYEDDKVTDYVSSPAPIDFEDLPVTVLENLRKLIKEGNDVSISDEEIVIILEGKEEEEEKALDEDEEEALEDEDGAEGSDAAGTGSEEGEPEPTPEDGAVQEGTGDGTGEGQSDATPTTTSSASKPTSTPTPAPTAAQDTSTASYTVTFMYDGSVFGTQTVTGGSKATQPQLSPSASGDWDFDFSKPITGNTTIQWK